MILLFIYFWFIWLTSHACLYQMWSASYEWISYCYGFDWAQCFLVDDSRNYIDKYMYTWVVVCVWVVIAALVEAVSK